MESRSEAVAALRIKEEFWCNKEEIELAYQKMVRRYPPNLFPDKFRQIRAAYDLLANTNDYWQQFIKSETQNLYFLAPLMAKNANDSTLSAPQDCLDDRMICQALIRYMISNSEQIEFGDI